MHNNPIISVKNLDKIYTTKSEPFLRKKITKEIHALNNITFDVFDGELICLLGPNGAGKTTLIKILTMLLLKSSGVFSINGFPSDLKYENQIKASIRAMLMGERGLYWKLTGEENLKYFYALYHQLKNRMKEYMSYLSDLMNVADIASRPVETYSSGRFVLVIFCSFFFPFAVLGPLVILSFIFPMSFSNRYA